MTPIEQAFEAWYALQGIAGMPTDMERSAFEAGYNAGLQAAIAQSVVSRTNEAGGAGSTPAGGSISAEDVYAAYPRKVGKQAALKAIRKAGKAVGVERLLKAVKAYAEATSRWPTEERQYIPHPATWFTRGSYDDDPKEWERGTAHVSQFSVTH